MTTPTQRSLKKLRDDGWTVAIVEKWNAHIKRRQDLFGFADLLAMAPGQRPLLIQTTTATNFSARRVKILAEPKAAIALESGFDILIHGWRKPTKTIRIWRLREELILGK